MIMQFAWAEFAVVFHVKPLQPVQMPTQKWNAMKIKTKDSAILCNLNQGGLISEWRTTSEKATLEIYKKSL